MAIESLPRAKSKGSNAATNVARRARVVIELSFRVKRGISHRLMNARFLACVVEASNGRSFSRNCGIRMITRFVVAASCRN